MRDAVTVYSLWGFSRRSFQLGIHTRRLIQSERVVKQRKYDRTHRLSTLSQFTIAFVCLDLDARGSARPVRHG